MKLSKLGQKLSDAGIKIVFDALQENESLIFDMYSVKLEFNGIESKTEYLGGCSYASFDQFTGTDNDYFDDMLLTCYNSLKAKFAIPRLELPLITF